MTKCKRCNGNLKPFNLNIISSNCNVHTFGIVPSPGTFHNKWVNEFWRHNLGCICLNPCHVQWNSFILSISFPLGKRLHDGEKGSSSSRAGDFPYHYRARKRLKKHSSVSMVFQPSAISTKHTLSAIMSLVTNMVAWRWQFTKWQQ